MNNYTYMTGSQTVRSRPGFYIGASDLPIILDLSKYTTPMDLWRQKSGRDPAFMGNEFTRWGNELEGLILKNVIARHGDMKTAMKFFIDYTRNMYKRRSEWKPKTQFEPFTECIHPDHPWLITHADCLLRTIRSGVRTYGKDSIIGEPYIIEAKSGGLFGNMRREDMDGYDPKDPTASGVPFSVFFQLQAQMVCYDIHYGKVAALIDTNKFSIYDVNANPKIQGKLIEVGSRMMYCLERDVPPTPKTFGDIRHLFPVLNEQRLTIMGEQAAIAWDIKERLKKARAQIKRGEAVKEDLMNAMALLIGGNSEMADEAGNKIASQSKWMQGNMLSPKKIKAGCPEAYALLDSAGLITESERGRITA